MFSSAKTFPLIFLPQKHSPEPLTGFSFPDTLFPKIGFLFSVIFPFLMSIFVSFMSFLFPERLCPDTAYIIYKELRSESLSETQS
ncbi:hypothetical protein MSMAP_2291 [Methanosarcina mazei SarPi]|uniref:Uncharacterized protein n=1 Tax=Methanosarcina mazei SarPi TaxID=1434115 RepID=A0A0E3LSS4_METMZ|nr:hypothetical protein MSMAP_2291 [Methanosarcina mazei SarPi]